MEIPKINWLDYVATISAFGVFYKLMSELIKGNVDKANKRAEVSKGVKEAHEEIQKLKADNERQEDKLKSHEERINTQAAATEKVRDVLLDISRRKLD